MKEYIDREALIAEYDRVHQGPAGGARKLMVDAPAADVVAVVRCKDCQWWEARSCNSFIGRCENPRNGLVSEYTDDKDFCSYGERKKQK